MGDFPRGDYQRSKAPWLNSASCDTEKGCYRYYMRSYRFVCVLSTHTSCNKGYLSSCHANLGHNLQSLGRRGSEHRGSVCFSCVSLVTFCIFGIIARVALRPVLRPCCVDDSKPYTINKHQGSRNADERQQSSPHAHGTDESLE